MGVNKLRSVLIFLRLADGEWSDAGCDEVSSCWFVSPRAAGLLTLMPVASAAPMLDLLGEERSADVLHFILPQKAAALMTGMAAAAAAVVLTRMDAHKAVQMLQGVQAGQVGPLP